MRQNRLDSFLPEIPGDFLETTSAKIGGEYDHGPLRYVARKRVGATETQNLVPDHDFPDIDNECESEKRSRKSGVPATLFRDDRFIRQFALALLNRQFARG